MFNIKYLLKLIYLCVIISILMGANKAYPVNDIGDGRPNFVIVIGDDCTWDDIDCYGGQAITPNIDKLATEGMQFMNASGSCAMCTPTLHSFYTGMYPMKHGGYKNHSSVNADTKSLVHYLKDLGYRVGHAGKRHIKPSEAFPFEFIEGFPKAALSQEPSPANISGIKEFMNRDESQPFCLVIYSIHPHFPYTVGNRSLYNQDSLKLRPYWADTKEMRSEYHNYLAEISELDNCVGRVLGLLDDEHLSDNTLFMFASEQGGAFPGEKWTLWEHGIRFGMIVKWPEKIKAGLKTEALVQYEDILPTLIDAAGGKSIRGIDGISMLGVLKGDKNNHRRYVFGAHNNKPDGSAYPIRSISDGRYKLIHNLRYQEVCTIECVMTWPEMRYWTSWVHEATSDETAAKAINRFMIRPEFEFYDLQDDIYEMNNLVNCNEHADRIELMKKELKKWMISQNDPGIEAD